MTKLKSLLSESRPTNILGFISKLRQHPDIENIIDIVGQGDGMTAFVRTLDGNAYEIQVRPAEYAKHPSVKEKTKGKK